MTDNYPLITIVVAVLNNKESLERCIESINNQTYPHKELILIDGGSTDGTVEILKNNDDNIAYWESKVDKGIYHAWNKALKHARGEWICFLGADDYFWNENVLSNICTHLYIASQSGIKVVHGRIARVDSKEKLIQFWGKPWEKNSWQIPHGMPIGMPHTGLMHHNSLFKEHGLFDENFKLAGDYEFLLRELKHKDRKVLFVNELITVAQQIGGAVDSNTFLFHQEVAMARKKNGFYRFSLLWWIIHIRTFFRHIFSSIKNKSVFI